MCANRSSIGTRCHRKRRDVSVRRKKKTGNKKVAYFFFPLLLHFFFLSFHLGRTMSECGQRGKKGLAHNDTRRTCLGDGGFLFRGAARKERRQMGWRESGFGVCRGGGGDQRARMTRRRRRCSARVAASRRGQHGHPRRQRGAERPTWPWGRPWRSTWRPVVSQSLSLVSLP